MRVGLTGNFGMGKSTVAAMFRDLGALTISTDEIVARLLQDREIVAKVRDIFGDAVIAGDGRIDKKALSAIVFVSPHLRIALEDLLHPHVFRMVDEEIGRLLGRDASVPVIIEAPVLFERGYQDRFDRIITVFTGEDVAVGRLVRRGVGEAEARRRLDSQMSIERKKAESDYLIDNSGPEADTRAQVVKIYGDLTRTENADGNRKGP